jgi:transaldolase
VSRLQRLHDAGVSIWLDALSRGLIQSGEFKTLVDEFAVSGATSNPTIFAKAIGGSDRYDEQLRSLASAGIKDTRELFFAVALEDVRMAAGILRPIHEHSRGADGFVSFECTPDLAEDTEGTVVQGLDLWQRIDLPNVLIKVPATRPGVGAIEELIARGVNVNVTLLFSEQRYEEVVEAYMRGLERRLEAGESVDRISSVASFFVSRVDAKADAVLAPDSAVRGHVAIANAHNAYSRYLDHFTGARWRRLQARGARPQRPLWASTGTKDPTYSDVLYVERLIAPGVINTMPEKTLRAFAEHGHVEVTLEHDPGPARAVLAAAAREGVDLTAITRELEHEGVRAFCDSYQQLLGSIDSKICRVTTAVRCTRHLGPA